MFFQLTHVEQHEFSKIGNKVFIPSGVANLFPKIESLAKHIVPCTLQTINGSTRVKHFLNVDVKTKAADSCNERSLAQILFAQAMGRSQSRPAIGLGVWPFSWKKESVAKG